MQINQTMMPAVISQEHPKPYCNHQTGDRNSRWVVLQTDDACILGGGSWTTRQMWGFERWDHRRTKRIGGLCAFEMESLGQVWRCECWLRWIFRQDRDRSGWRRVVDKVKWTVCAGGKSSGSELDVTLTMLTTEHLLFPVGRGRCKHRSRYRL